MAELEEITHALAQLSTKPTPEYIQIDPAIVHFDWTQWEANALLNMPDSGRQIRASSQLRRCIAHLSAMPVSEPEKTAWKADATKKIAFLVNTMKEETKTCKTVFYYILYEKERARLSLNWYPL